jgi:alkaline phosphatase D
MGGTTGRIDRRAFLVGSAAGALTLGVGRWAGPAAAQQLPDPFTLGVASGDPLADRVILWTRLAPDPLNGGGMPPADVPVLWEVASDEAFTDVVATGTAVAEAQHAHTVHVDATGLAPDTWYWYRFTALAFVSPTGRTRTAPGEGCTADSLRFGFASCQNWTAGFYAAHRHLAAEDLDLTVFLGDYIYEGGGGGVRPHNSGEIFTLLEYRNRYAQYKGDADLQASHAARPWLVIWDDHEVDNNYADDNHEGGDPPAAFLERRAAAYKAWWEHQPVRLAPPTGPDLGIHRTFTWGGIADLLLLDGRQYRDDQACGDGLQVPCAGWDDPARSMLGAEQEQWLFDDLQRSQATWKVVANQTVFTKLPLGSAFNMDQWDGYPASQQRVHDALAGITNPIVITGDIHAAGIAELRADYDDPDSAVIGTELVGTSISSTFPPELVDAAEAIISSLPWISYANARDRGYAVVDLTHDRMEATYRVVDDPTDPGSGVRTDTTHTVASVGLGAACAPGSTTTTTSEGPATTSTTSTSTTQPADPGAPTGPGTAPTGTTPPARPVTAQPTYTG